MSTYYYEPAEIAARATADGISAQCTDIQAKARQYQDLVLQELRRNLLLLATSEQISNEQIPFALTKIRNKLGRYGKPQKEWWNWLHQNFPLVEIIKKGNSHQKVITMVEIKIPLEILLAGNDAEELIRALYSEVDDKTEFCDAPINLRSLNCYIQSATAMNSTNKTIQDNITKAKMIQMIAKHCDGKLPQIVNRSIFGRTYYRGPNLQNCHKTVREAALGRCYSIDINSSVFNWKYSEVPFCDEFSYTRELIQDKNRIRKYLAKLVFGNTEKYSIKTIKRVLTAISFGAKAETTCWFRNPTGSSPAFIQGAISTIITSKDKRKQLFEDPWMVAFMAEQDRINSYIYRLLTEAARNGQIPELTLNELKTQGGRISKTKMIAWAYQQCEQLVMKEMLKYCGTEVLLQVHDGVYLKNKPDVASMRTVLRDNWPLADIEVEEIQSYTYQNVVDISDHRSRIKKEEAAANNGIVPYTPAFKKAVKQNNPHIEPDWEQRHRAQLDELNQNQHPEFIQNLIRRDQ